MELIEQGVLVREVPHTLEAQEEALARCDEASAFLDTVRGRHLNIIKSQKLWMQVARSWTSYCDQRLRISRRHADRMIRQYSDSIAIIEDKQDAQSGDKVGHDVPTLPQSATPAQVPEPGKDAQAGDTAKPQAEQEAVNPGKEEEIAELWQDLRDLCLESVAKVRSALAELLEEASKPELGFLRERRTRIQHDLDNIVGAIRSEMPIGQDPQGRLVVLGQYLSQPEKYAAYRSNVPARYQKKTEEEIPF
jgi:hypothetical protein